jgi:hypothetical protein
MFNELCGPLYTKDRESCSECSKWLIDTVLLRAIFQERMWHLGPSPRSLCILFNQAYPHIRQCRVKGIQSVGPNVGQSGVCRSGG